jgi:hypothetical protein
MNQHSPLLKANQNRCKSCGGLLNTGGGHFNLTDCRQKRSSQARRGNTIGWHSFPTGWEADSPKDFWIEGA